MTDKLKLCPFCGGKATTSEKEHIESLPRGVGWVGCQRCRVFIDWVRGDRGKKLAIEAWNKRKPIDETMEQLEKEKEYQKKNAIDKNFRIGVVNGLNAAIRIVKGGAE